MNARTMSRSRKDTVQIVNPIPNGAHYTSRKSALQFVRRGVAAFENGESAIRFLNQRRQELRRGDPDCGDEFHWRVGITGKMVQVMASRAPIMTRHTK